MKCCDCNETIPAYQMTINPHRKRCGFCRGVLEKKAERAKPNYFGGVFSGKDNKEAYDRPKTSGLRSE